ncbi:hypothetical protein FHT79_001375 [Rhizobium sp. BK212]|nr:hypothetical protein [Rhizobium sp. BK212]
MGVAFGEAARTVFDQHALDALARHVRKLVLVNEGDLRGLVCVVRAGAGGCKAGEGGGEE